ncbi:hypothetical protein RF819_09550 [Rhodoferax fermentans]|uniref:Uncharacterized protein n=1 Tax=Rhodoferax fermentans TaxID=28066 RepID=A0A1T1AYB7_RHOFE|nr:hypothetical protein RF819_09550 [Rhodoferax fermentans]
MPFMVCTTWPTTSPPCCATAEALMASWLAVRADSAFCLTVAPSSSMLAEVSSSALACCSVRADRSWLASAISELAVATPSEPLRTLLTTSTRLACIKDKASSSSPTSSRLACKMRAVRSPLAVV